MNSMKDLMTNVRSVLGMIIELGISLIALAVIIQVLFGAESTAFIGGNVVQNIIDLVGQLGSAGLVGLVAVGVLLYVFSKRATTTS